MQYLTDLKIIRYVIYERRGLSCSGTSSICQDFPKSDNLLHKQGFVDSLLQTTVDSDYKIYALLTWVLKVLCNYDGKPNEEKKQFTSFQSPNKVKLIKTCSLKSNFFVKDNAMIDKNLTNM